MNWDERKSETSNQTGKRERKESEDEKQGKEILALLGEAAFCYPATVHMLSAWRLSLSTSHNNNRWGRRRKKRHLGSWENFLGESRTVAGAGEERQYNKYKSDPFTLFWKANTWISLSVSFGYWTVVSECCAPLRLRHVGLYVNKGYTWKPQSTFTILSHLLPPMPFWGREIIYSIYFREGTTNNWKKKIIIEAKNPSQTSGS